MRHRFEKAGEYQVKLEVLDGGGNVSRVVKTVTVVNNTAPTAYFKYAPISGTTKTVFTFQTSASSDDQYFDHALQYRFDWDGDGKWDTKFQSRTQWNHQFGEAGNYTVIMETRDPEGQKGQARTSIIVSRNTLPHARLFYRWDFNYHGSDDII